MREDVHMKELFKCLFFTGKKSSHVRGVLSQSEEEKIGDTCLRFLTDQYVLYRNQMSVSVRKCLTCGHT
jgi:hypothetical protein